ncbi:hypothetical protein BD311DRAFT_663582 [Dichomitus squalens]|uniref:DUF6534 domain-containing protein n=1 Tax=Dichomitus squalens TaxID=114155 RepID=A0A4Q9MNB4_9APHY|nr:hypothetical protein BD311DRAFT_663582 [Dichomitus squalens]
MGADATITGSLVYILGHLRTGFKRTDATLDLLIAYALSTGLVTCMFHIVNVIASIVWQHNLIWIVPVVILFKLYANNFLVALNSRKALGFMTDKDESEATSSRGGLALVNVSTPGLWHGNLDGRGTHRLPVVPLRIFQHTTSEMHSDSVDLDVKAASTSNDVLHIA